jgi:outer membrane lipoprotein-sorting protein
MRSCIVRRILVAVLLVTAAASAGAAADDARQIMQEAQRRTEVTSQRYEGLLNVVDDKGKVTVKRWMFQRIGSHGHSKSVVRFTDPPEVKGVALLIINHPDRASDQWMWTPAIERDRRIAMQDRSTRFFGTDFTFEDLEERDIDQYAFSLEGEEALDGVACWKIRSTPNKARSSQYTHSLLWVRKDNYAVARIENYVKAGLLRRLDYSDIQNVQGIWTARQMEMADLSRRSRTRLTREKLQYNVPLSNEDFTLEALRR